MRLEKETTEVKPEESAPASSLPPLTAQHNDEESMETDGHSLNSLESENSHNPHPETPAPTRLMKRDRKEYSPNSPTALDTDLPVLTSSSSPVKKSSFGRILKKVRNRFSPQKEEESPFSKEKGPTPVTSQDPKSN
jgi:hypothetical protein